MSVRAHVGLGSNVGDRLAILRSAIAAIDAIEDVVVVLASGIYETPPWGGVEQDPFYNAVVAVDADLTADELLAELQLIEVVHGRDRDAEQRWGPRTLDLDLLTYGNQVLVTDDLVVPHPRLRERAFVLVPLMEVWPGGTLPDGTRLTRAAMDLAGQDGTGLAGIDLVLRLTDGPGVGGIARPAGPRAPAAIPADEWHVEHRADTP